MINNISSRTAKLLDLSYTVKFILRLAALYILFRGVNILWVGLVAPGGVYSAFIDHYLNYITLTKVSVLQTASIMAKPFGVVSYLPDNSTIKIVGASHLFMAWACCGFEIMSFWAAFVLADTTPVKTKIYWCLGGLFCIWLINCLRVTLLVIAMKYHWKMVPSLSEHDTFTIAAYLLVFLLMFIYYKKNKMQLGI